MKLYSTKNKNLIVDLKEAVLKSLAPDKGLYMPTDLPKLDDRFIENLSSFSFQEIAFQVCSALFKDTIAPNDLMEIITNSMTFPAPVVNIHDHISTLELFHGPSLAFKDFGARFMSQLMSYFNRNEKDLTILVATSGDTGGAVAAGFLKTPGIEVVILYPSGKVSDIQEKQLTALGNNITACEIDGNFDDCQRMVKEAFLDKELNQQYNLSSANSINIARLIPQSFYYFEALKQVKSKHVVVVVPSGNFGNLTAGLMAKQMGLPIKKFIAATNRNHVVPDYLDSGNYTPMESIQTIANAMDVGSPSNFTRMQEIYPDVDSMRNDILGMWFDDDQIRAKIKEVYKRHNYILDPHGAIGYLASEKYLKGNPNDHLIFLETAHPCKFIDEVEKAIETNVPVPSSIKDLMQKEKQAHALTSKYEDFKSWMLQKN